MKLPSPPTEGESVKRSFRELLNWLRANNITSVVGGRLTETPSGKTLFINPGGGRPGGSSESGYTPWKPSFFTEVVAEVTTYKCTINLGTVNNIPAGNWNDDFTLPSDDTIKFVVLTITTASGKVTGLTISIDTSAPTEDVIAKDTPPVEHKIVLGAIGKTTAKMIIDKNITILGTEVFRETKAAPATGSEPFSRWWRWSIHDPTIAL